MKSILMLLLTMSGTAMAIEEPTFTVITKNSDYEIRQYSPILGAETKVAANFENAGNEGFRILAKFIFGENKSKAKIAMTSPVNQEPAKSSEKIAMTAPVNLNKGSSGYVVQFTMPKEYTLETLPTPNDNRVEIRQIPARKIAVLTYSGSWSEKRYQEKLAQLKEALKRDGLEAKGEPVLARYNSPFQLWFLRRNEIWLEL